VLYSTKDYNIVTVIKKGIPVQKMKKLLNEACSKAPKKEQKKYVGALKTEIDPLEYQNK
jgi:hypothetical protein